MKPLEGIRVLDLSRLLPGPFASLALVDLGARVDKIEDPSGGDYLRGVPPFAGGVSRAFAALNRGKRSAVLDLKSSEGQEAFRLLLPSYDVLLEQFRPGVLERMGLAPEALLTLHPGLVLCSLTGYGQTGPLASRAGHDLNYLARSGLLGFQGPASGPPQVPGFQVADVGGALWAVSGICAALYERTRTGKGRHVDVSMTDAALGFGIFQIARSSDANVARGEDHLTGGLAPYSTYETQDGRFVALAALEPKFWRAFCEAVGVPFDLSALVPGPHQARLREELSQLFKSRTRSEWETLASSIDACLEPIIEPAELLHDSQLSQRSLVPGKTTGLRYLKTPLAASTEVDEAVPALGEHTRAILEEAGLGREWVDRLAPRAASSN